MFEPDEVEAFKAYLIDKGAMFFTGVETEDGPEVGFNPELMEIYAPGVWERLKEEMQKEADEALLKLYKLGLVDIEFNEDLDAEFTITELGKQVVENG